MDMDVVQENKPGDLHTSTLNMTPSKYLQLLPEGLKVSSINSQGIPDLQAAIAQMLQDLELGSTWTILCCVPLWESDAWLICNSQFEQDDIALTHELDSEPYRFVAELLVPIC